jgi:DNA polymerase-1
MIELYDSNNVLRRVTERQGMPSVIPMGFRQRYEYVMAKPPGTQIWVWDGFGHNDMRKAILPYYKANRTPAAEDIYAQINLWKKALDLSHAVQITVEGWEADDVIATLVKQWAAKGVRVRVHSNDIDYGQLADHCELVGVNLKDTPGRWLPLRKALVGKASDNMKGIPNFGPKRFLEMAPRWAQIERAIETDAQDALLLEDWTPAVRAWLVVEDNFKELQAMLRVAKFFDVPEDEILGGWKQGTPNRKAAHEMMKEFFL